jgi:hypothetical protein
VGWQERVFGGRNPPKGNGLGITYGKTRCHGPVPVSTLTRIAANTNLGYIYHVAIG